MSPKERFHFVLKQLKEYNKAINQCRNIYALLLGLKMFVGTEYDYALSVLLNLSFDKPIDESQQEYFMEKNDEKMKCSAELSDIFDSVEIYLGKKMKTYQCRYRELTDESYRLANCGTNDGSKKRKREDDCDDRNETVVQTQPQTQPQTILQLSPSVLKIKQNFFLNLLIEKHMKIIKSLETVRLFIVNHITIIHMVSQNELYIKSECSMLLTMEKNFYDIMTFVLEKMKVTIRHFENELFIDVENRYNATIPPYEPLDIYELFYAYNRTVPLVPEKPPVMDLPVFPQSPEISYFDNENDEQAIWL